MSAIDNLQDRFVWKTFDEMPPAGNSRLFDALGHSGRAGQFAGGGRPQSETSADKTAEQELTKSIETANTYLEGDYAAQAGPDSEDFPLAEAILGALVLRQKIAEGATQELIDLELALADAIKRDAGSSFLTPNIQVVPNGQIVEDANGNIVIELENGEVGTSDDYPDVLPMDANGAFVPGEDGAPGTILISDVFINEDGHVVDDPEVLSDVVLEEFGEALADHVKTLGFGEGPGDVGNRLMKVFTGEDLTGADFEEDPARDTRDVLFGGAIAQGAKASAEVEGTVDGEGDQPAVQMTTPVAAATTNNALTPPSEEAVAQVERLHGGPPFTEASYPNVEDWDLVVDTYGTVNAGSLTINELAQAIDDGAVDVKNTGTEDADGKDMIVDRVDETKFTHADGMARSFADYAGIWGITPTDDTVPADFVESAYNSAVSLYESSGYNLDPWSGEGLDANSSDLDGWDQLLTIYGQPKHTVGTEGEAGLVMQLDDVTRAIADGALGVSASGPDLMNFEIASVNLSAVSNTTLTDAMWRYTERQSGHHRVQMGGQLLAESVAAITGDTDGFDQSNTEQLDAIFDNFADVPHGDDFRLSKDAVQNIWDSGAFTRLDSTGNTIEFEVNPDATAVDADGQAEDIELPAEGEWRGFGFYGDQDQDNVMSGVDPDNDVEYGREEIPAGANIPADAEFIAVYDNGGSEDRFGVKRTRTVTYHDPSTGDVITKLIDMTPESETEGEVLFAVAEHEDGGLTGKNIGDEPAVTFSSDEMDEIADALEETEADSSASGYDTDSVAELATHLGDTYPGVEIIDSYGKGVVAWVKYRETPEGPEKNLFKFSEVEAVADPYFPPLVHDPVYGTIVEGEAGWSEFETAIETQQAADDAEISPDNIFPTVTETVVGGGFKVFTDYVTSSIPRIVGAQMTFPQATALKMAGKNGLVIWKMGEFFFNGLKSSLKSDAAHSSFKAAADVVETTETLTEPPAHYNDSDLGVLGLDRPAYFYPADATILKRNQIGPDESPYNVLTEEIAYKRPGEPDTVYVVNIDASDPGSIRDGIVLHGIKTVTEEVDGKKLTDVTTYDSFGTETSTQVDLDLTSVIDPITEAELLGDPDSDLSLVVEKVRELHSDADILQTHSAGPLTYASYQVPGKTGIRVYMLERHPEDEGGGHSHADGWLSSPAVQAFFQGFSYFQSALQTFVTAKQYVDAGNLASEVLDYLLQNIDLPGLAGMATGATSTALTPYEAATVRQTALVAGMLPFLSSAATLFTDMAMVAGGPEDFALAENSMARASNEEDVLDLDGEGGDIAIPAEDEIPAPDPAPVAPESMNTDGRTMHLLSSTNPHGSCAGVTAEYLSSRLYDGIDATDPEAVRRDALLAAPIERGLPNQDADESRDRYAGIFTELQNHWDYFEKMNDPNDPSVTDFLATDADELISPAVLLSKYATMTHMALDRMDVTSEFYTSDIDNLWATINAEGSKGKAYLLEMDPISESGNTIGGHEIAVVRELDGGVTVMNASGGLTYYAEGDEALKSGLKLRRPPQGTIDTYYRLTEVKNETEDDSMKATYTKMLDWYKEVTGETLETNF